MCSKVQQKTSLEFVCCSSHFCDTCRIVKRIKVNQTHYMIPFSYSLPLKTKNNDILFFFFHGVATQFRSHYGHSIDYINGHFVSMYTKDLPGYQGVIPISYDSI